MVDQPIVVTGTGAVSPYGVGRAALFAGLRAGRSTGRRIAAFDPAAYPSQVACEVPGFDAGAFIPRKLARQTDRFQQFAMVASEEALDHANLLADADADGARRTTPPRPIVDGLEPARVAVVIASSIGGITQLTDQYARLLSEGPARVSPYFAIAMPINLGGGHVAIRHGLRGPVVSPVSACASAADAVVHGADLLRTGRVDVAVVGGAEAAVNPIVVAGFSAAGALSRRNAEPARASRPFDVDRDGFVPGEGAGALVLERAAHAAARGARPLAELAGWDVTNDAHHPTRPAPDGRGAVDALRRALANADLAPDEVDHVNAHGTSTPANDATESAALRTVFGAHADRVTVTSTKSAIGHLLGAAGAVEAIATIEAMAHDCVPPSLNLDRQDPACDVDVVTGAPRSTPTRVACSNSFGFGGHNAVLVLRTV